MSNVLHKAKRVVASTVNHGGAAAVIVVGSVVKPAPATWHNLSRSTQMLFRTGGLGRGLGLRSPAMAQRLFETQVPAAVRSMGEHAVRDFLERKHFSHVRSVANAPSRAKAPSNVILENAKVNLSRGSRNMNNAARIVAKTANRDSAIKTGARVAAKNGAKAGLAVAALEAAVAIPENVLHYRRGRKSAGEAAMDTLESTATAGCVAGVAVGVANAAATTGIGLSLGPFGVPLAIAGGTVFAGTAARRIYRAARA